ncbi:hypothetical protein D3C81_1980960 [compost metagenome]
MPLSIEIVPMTLGKTKTKTTTTKTTTTKTTTTKTTFSKGTGNGVNRDVIIKSATTCLKLALV